MEKIKVTVLELFIIRNFITGINELKGFVNEAGLTEGTKRKANKVLRIVNQELEPIGKQLEEIRAEKNQEKEADLLKDECEIEIEKLDFKLIENLSLSCNYEFLYEKIFVN
jgi:hypothetical protein